MENLDTGILYWFKSQRSGQVAVPLHYLTDEQKETLKSGLASGKYELCNPYQFFSTHYMWLDDNRRGYFHVTDIQISPEIKRILSPRNPATVSFPYRFTLSDMNRLQDELISGEVDEIYVERILKDTPWKPWDEKEWKLKRDTIIESACKYCGSQEMLVLQHTIQPRKINAVLYELNRERHIDFLDYEEQNKNTIKLTFPENIQKVPVCPKCGSSRVHFRTHGQNKGTYVCNKSNNYEICKHKFANPDSGYDEKDIQKAEKKRTAAHRYNFNKKEGVLLRAAKISLEEIIEYLNLTHTITLCSKCAYEEDRPFDKYH